MCHSLCFWCEPVLVALLDRLASIPSSCLFLGEFMRNFFWESL